MPKVYNLTVSLQKRTKAITGNKELAEGFLGDKSWEEASVHLLSCREQRK